MQSRLPSIPTSELASGPPRLVLLLSVAVGVSVANIYYAQPLAVAIANDLQASEAQVGTAMTLTQVGYALGMLLLVPLGDGRERRNTIVATTATAVASLVLVAMSNSILALQLASVMVGLTSAVAQMIVPYAVSLGTHEQRGRIVGSVMGGLLTGILLSRLASGVIGDMFGWRVMYWIAAATMAGLGIVLRLALPTQQPDQPMPWVSIMRSLGRVFISEPTLRKRSLVGGLGMASFSVFWSMLAFHLGESGHGSTVAGMFGIIGVVGVLVGPIAGRLAVGPGAARINIVGLGAVAISFAVFFWGANSLIAIGIGVAMLDAGIQASHLANQTVIYGLAPTFRNRINAIYMVSYFVGGTIGTFAASIAWSLGQWPAVCAIGVAFALLGVVPLLNEP